MEFPLVHGNRLGDEYEWEMLLQKYLTHSSTNLTFNDNSSTLTVFKKKLVNMMRNMTFSARNIQVITLF